MYPILPSGSPDSASQSGQLRTESRGPLFPHLASSAISVIFSQRHSRSDSESGRNPSLPERWQSGRMRRIANPVGAKASRGFESPLLRCFSYPIDTYGERLMVFVGLFWFDYMCPKSLLLSQSICLIRVV